MISFFEDAQEAISFAISAKLHQEEDRNFEVEIDIISIEEDDVAEDPEDD